jgi:hypothetical protein
MRSPGTKFAGPKSPGYQRRKNSMTQERSKLAPGGIVDAAGRVV